MGVLARTNKIIYSTYLLCACSGGGAVLGAGETKERVAPGDTDVLGEGAGNKRLDGSQMAFRISATEKNRAGMGRGSWSWVQSTVSDRVLRDAPWESDTGTKAER